MSITRSLILFVSLVTGMLAVGIVELYFLDLVDLSEDAYRHGLGIIRWVTPFVVYGMIFYFSKFKFDLKAVPGKLNSLKPQILLYIFAIAIGLEFLDRPLFDFQKIRNFVFNGNVEPYFLPEADRFIVYTGIFAMLLAPVFEELFFRKFLFGKLLSRYSVTTSILVSSVCFALFHLPSYRNLLPTFIYGVITCLIYKKTGNILYTIILHVLVNFFWFTLQYWGGDFYNWIFQLQFNLIYWLLFIFGIFLTYLAINRIFRLTANIAKK